MVAVACSNDVGSTVVAVEDATMEAVVVKVTWAEHAALAERLRLLLRAEDPRRLTSAGSPERADGELLLPRMLRTASAASSSLLISLSPPPRASVSCDSSARTQTWPAPCLDLVPFLKWGFMLRLWRTLFFQRSSSALKYG